jgi:ribokinase
VYTAKAAFNAGAKVILNPAPARELPDSLLAITDILIPNRGEAELLSGVGIDSWEDAEKAALALRDKGVKKVIITLGSMGALLLEEKDPVRIPTRKVEVVDTTAAGDTFCGALCVALTEGRTMTEAIEFANRCSGISIGRMGAQASMPYRSELDNT